MGPWLTVMILGVAYTAIVVQCQRGQFNRFEGSDRPRPDNRGPPRDFEGRIPQSSVRGFGTDPRLFSRESQENDRPPPQHGRNDHHSREIDGPQHHDSRDDGPPHRERDDRRSPFQGRGGPPPRELVDGPFSRGRDGPPLGHRDGGGRLQPHSAPHPHHEGNRPPVDHADPLGSRHGFETSPRDHFDGAGPRGDGTIVDPQESQHFSQSKTPHGERFTPHSFGRGQPELENDRHPPILPNSREHSREGPPTHPHHRGGPRFPHGAGPPPRGGGTLSSPRFENSAGHTTSGARFPEITPGEPQSTINAGNGFFPRGPPPPGSRDGRGPPLDPRGGHQLPFSQHGNGEEAEREPPHRGQGPHPNPTHGFQRGPPPPRPQDRSLTHGSIENLRHPNSFPSRGQEQGPDSTHNPQEEVRGGGKIIFPPQEEPEDPRNPRGPQHGRFNPNSPRRPPPGLFPSRPRGDESTLGGGEEDAPPEGARGGGKIVFPPREGTPEGPLDHGRFPPQPRPGGFDPRGGRQPPFDPRGRGPFTNGPRPTEKEDSREILEARENNDRGRGHSREVNSREESDFDRREGRGPPPQNRFDPRDDPRNSRGPPPGLRGSRGPHPGGFDPRVGDPRNSHQGQGSRESAFDPRGRPPPQGHRFPPPQTSEEGSPPHGSSLPTFNIDFEKLNRQFPKKSREELDDRDLEQRDGSPESADFEPNRFGSRNNHQPPHGERGLRGPPPFRGSSLEREDEDPRARGGQFPHHPRNGPRPDFRQSQEEFSREQFEPHQRGGPPRKGNNQFPPLNERPPQTRGSFRGGPRSGNLELGPDVDYPNLHSGEGSRESLNRFTLDDDSRSTPTKFIPPHDRERSFERGLPTRVVPQPGSNAHDLRPPPPLHERIPPNQAGIEQFQPPHPEDLPPHFDLNRQPPPNARNFPPLPPHDPRRPKSVLPRLSRSGGSDGADPQERGLTPPHRVNNAPLYPAPKLDPSNLDFTRLRLPTFAPALRKRLQHSADQEFAKKINNARYEKGYFSKKRRPISDSDKPGTELHESIKKDESDNSTVSTVAQTDKDENGKLKESNPEKVLSQKTEKNVAIGINKLISDKTNKLINIP